MYGSLGTGINLSFIQEVQVKTAAYEPKYGGVNGGMLQIVTKSGGTQVPWRFGCLHGAGSHKCRRFDYADNLPAAISAGHRLPARENLLAAGV